METLLFLDAAFTRWISNIFPHNIFFDAIFSFLSLEGIFLFIWIAILIFLFFIEEKKNKTFIPFFFLSLVLTLFTVDMLLKPLFQRPRPYVAQKVDSLVCPKNFSFPSGHAAGAFAGATILASYDKKRRKYYYLIASFISLSRIYLQCHFLFDVASGALLGYTISKLILRLRSYSTVKSSSKKSRTNTKY